jgi:hypothetical protein
MHGLELLNEALQRGLPLLAQLTRHFAQATAMRASQADGRLKSLPLSCFLPLLELHFFLRGMPNNILPLVKAYEPASRRIYIGSSDGLPS